MATSMTEQASSVEAEADSNWTEQATTKKGRVFASDDGRRLEVFYQNGDEWSAELFHRYGCTRLFVRDSEQEVYEELVSRGTLPADIVCSDETTNQVSI
jgi:hypothetical protein